MDEPTSGLDARAAAIVIRTIRNTINIGKTVVCTIHQLSIDIFEAFDELFLMKRGGQEIYVGPLGRHSCHLIKYFESMPGVHKTRISIVNICSHSGPNVQLVFGSNTGHTGIIQLILQLDFSSQPLLPWFSRQFSGILG